MGDEIRVRVQGEETMGFVEDIRILGEEREMG